MDDPHSRQQIDELAELYLTRFVDPAPAPKADEPDEAEEAEETKNPAEAQTGAATDRDDPLAGPEPIRLAPKLGDAARTDAEDGAETDADHTTTTKTNAEQNDGPPMLRLTREESEALEADTPHQEAPAQAAADTAEHAATASPTPQAPPATEAEREPQAQPATTAQHANDTGADQATEPADPPMRQPAPQAIVEAVLIGNLPGMSGPWLTQYAQLLAQTEGPVAILHLGDEAIDLELVEPRAEAQPAPRRPLTAVRIPPMRPGMSGLVGLLDALVRSEHGPARNILVRIDTPADPRNLNQLNALDDWTLLCGADDASAAGVVHQLRLLVRADPRLADRNVGLMVMGSEEPAARRTAQRIAADLQDDLAKPVELIGHLKRMQPVQVRDIGSFPDPAGVWPQLAAWFDTLQTPEPLPQPTREQTAEDAARTTRTPPQQAAGQPRLSPEAERLAQAARAAKTARPASSAQARPQFRQTPPTQPTPTLRPRTTQKSTAAETAQQKPPRPDPTERQKTANATPHRPTATTHTAKPAQAAEPTRPAPRPRVLSPQPELDLVALLAQGPAALDDPATLDARIPDQPDTQLAVDAHGVVHILLHHTRAQGSDPASDAVSDAVMRLIQAGRWVREHLELIALTQRDRDFIDTDPVLHLFTDRADTAVQRVGKLGNQVRLHLLQQVQVGRETGWFCTPLG